MSTEETRAVISQYLDGHAADVLADNAVFTVMGTGERANGRDEIRQMLTSLYETAFEARADLRNLVIGDGSAVAEYDFVGRHTGEFAGIAATDKHVQVPFCVAYDVAEGKIVAARVYFEMSALRRQIGAAGLV